jgi:hydrogenase maturation protease
MLVGIGNASRRDDGVGPFLARTFCDPVWRCLDAGTAPEQHSSLIRKYRPRCVVLVDAARMGLPQGSVRRVPPACLDARGAGTHAMPLSFFAAYLERRLSAEVIVLAIEPAEIADGEGLSPAVARAAEVVRAILARRAWDEVPWWKEE